MYEFETDYYLASPGGYGVVGKPKKADPSQQYVGGGPNWSLPNQLRAMPSECSAISRRLTPEIYKAMLLDSAVSSTYRGLQLSILADGPTLASPVKAPAWYRRDNANDSPDTPKPDAESSPKRELSPKQKLAEDVLAYCERLISRLGVNFLEADRQSLDCMGFGVKLTEVTTERLTSGIDAGKEVWKSLQVKPNSTWRFVVDPYLAVKGILAWSPKTGRHEVYDATQGKFIWHSWMPQDGDPRGTSVLEAAYYAWNLKIQCWPLYYQHLVRFGSPGLDMELAPNDQEDRPDFDSQGVEIPGGKWLSPADYARKALQLFRGGGTIVRASGSKLDMFEPRSEGDAFLKAMDLFSREICIAIGLQARMSSTDKSGGKADGEAAQDLRGVVVMAGRDHKALVLRDALRANVALNWGRDVADEMTPVASYGATEAQDKASLWASVSTLRSSGFLTDSMKEQVCSDVGLPAPDMAADAAAETAKADADAERKAKTAPPVAPGQPGPDATPGKRPVGIPRGNSGKGDNK